LLYSTRSKLITSFVGVSILVGIVSLLVGSQLLYKTVFNEARTRISLDLNAAREIYLSRIQTVYTALDISALDEGFISAIGSKETDVVLNKLRRIAQKSNLDFAGIVDLRGNTLYRIGPNPVSKGGTQAKNPIVDYVMKRGEQVSGSVVLDKSFLLSENPAMAEQARIQLLETPRAAPRPEEEETSGMALAAGIPIYKQNSLTAVLYGGILLNRSNEIVDTVRETVFKDEVYKGRSIGTATIFFKDLRISTNVLTPEGNRAIGTRVSKEVRDKVLINGEVWTDRAFVVNDWYITAYEPIIDLFGDRVGILYVGVLEDKYLDMRQQVLSIFIFITIAGILIAIGLGSLMASRIMKPVRQLIQVSREVSEGNLRPKIDPISKNEIGVLQKTFSEMLSSLRERDRRQQAESETKLLMSEKQASVGRRAAGVAHEINNPLTGVLTFTHMLLRRKDLQEEVRADLQTIAKETERVRAIVKGLLDFSRQTKLEPELTDINKLVRSAIALVDNQALVKGVTLEFSPTDGLPVRTMDRNQMQSVILNIMINAIDATEPGGTVTVKTGFSVSKGKTEQDGIEISIGDTGCGISKDNLGKIFDPFFTTKEVGQGTGLGLSVSYGIVGHHGGNIRVQSEVGKGSTFTIWLPIEDLHSEYREDRIEA